MISLLCLHFMQNFQMRPSFNPFSLYDANKVVLEKKTSSISQLWHQNGRCPKDTIPIRRTRKDDLLRASSIERYGKKSHGAIPNDVSVSHDGYIHEHSFAVANGQHYGTSVFMSVWNPYVHDPLEFSNTQLWLFGGPREFLNTVEAGWHVYPNLYGDNRTRLFTYWTNDRYRQTGCYNLLCSAFVQVSNKVALGSSLKPVSNYDGQQYGILVVVYKDQKTGNWWLQFGNKLDIGYWPASLVKHLSRDYKLKYK
ncbi:uncharacterized protein LOC103717664 isoform X1 [Phoenix dactylifera]|uniref:Uncharacterized protein LOC103717664 isoform X1 n=2 Tax=Phoenix dactylifera TaxID=42345 RepID=A0A8B8JA56_PHODC|nr:uncharacterized protein LOC103717664 isoform X1 [Phoenix dactylifera]XP_026664458.2 uncharacterized protein LOC103717664 isoform X1 [Phoenix dactylifera]